MAEVKYYNPRINTVLADYFAEHDFRKMQEFQGKDDYVRGMYRHKIDGYVIGCGVFLTRKIICRSMMRQNYAFCWEILSLLEKRH